MDTIFIRGLKVDAIIGIYSHEKINKQPLVFNIEISYDTTQACDSDSIEHTVDYHQICNEIYDYVSHSSFNLIEALANKVAQMILANTKVKEVVIEILKPNALENADTAGIKIARKQNSRI